ncbi:hypothetical protein F4801DRAFT_198007 [Xylaria longipes]|nr:hypothetical protein F4801DRAFT_198007 [Xylaria longipes]
MEDGDTLTFCNDEKTVAKTHQFSVSIRMPPHHHIQLMKAVKNKGQKCYISKELINPYIHGLDVGGLYIAWRRPNDIDFTYKWCEVLGRSKVRGEADLVLGRDYRSCSFGSIPVHSARLRLTSLAQHNSRILIVGLRIDESKCQGEHYDACFQYTYDPELNRSNLYHLLYSPCARASRE